MKRRIFALALACALSLSLLSACGGAPANDASSGQPGGSSSADQSQPAAPEDTSPQPPAPEVSQPDGSTPDPVQPQQPAQTKMTLNRTDFSLFTAGATFRLKAADVPEGAEVVWSSSDEAVATVGKDGTVTALSAGSVTVTAAAGEQSVTCKVYCKLADKPAAGGDSSSGSGSGSTSQPAPTQVDLSAFYTTLSGSYDFPSSMALADAQLQDALFSGLSAVSTKQCLVYANMMSMNMGELVLVQVSDSKDVDAVKAILQARVDNMVNGGAWYPEPTRIWSECSSVVSNGSYILMAVSEDFQSIVNDFNALF